MKSQPGKGMYNREMKMKIKSQITEVFRHIADNESFKFKRIKIGYPYNIGGGIVQLGFIQHFPPHFQT